MPKSQSNMTDRRERLINSARDLVRQGGLAALSMRVLADREDTSTQAIYTLFGGKSGLLQAVYSHWMDDLEQGLLTAAMAGHPPEVMIWLSARLYREHALSDPALFLAGCTDKDVFALLTRSNAFRAFAALVSAGIASGALRHNDDPEATACALWSAAHGAVLFEIQSGGRSYLEELLQALLRGISAPSPA